MNPLKRSQNIFEISGNFQKDSFCNDLSNAQWREIYDCTDPNEAYELFYTMFLEVCNKHAPIEEISFSSKKRNNPWITKSFKEIHSEKTRFILKNDKVWF